MFSLRSSVVMHTHMWSMLKALIRAQLRDDIKDFDIGYQQDSSVISIRSSADLLEV